MSARTTAPSLAISPQLQPPGSTALHFAAAAEDVSLVLVLLEAQVGAQNACKQQQGVQFMHAAVQIVDLIRVLLVADGMLGKHQHVMA